VLALLGAAALRRAYPALPLRDAAARAAGRLLSAGAGAGAGAARLLPSSGSPSPRSPVSGSPRSAGFLAAAAVRDLSGLATGAAGALGAGAGAGASERSSLLHSARTRASSSPQTSARVATP